MTQRRVLVSAYLAFIVSLTFVAMLQGWRI